MLPSKSIFSSMFDVLPSVFKPIFNLTQIFPESCNIILNSFLLAITPVLLHTNLAPALKGFFSSSKFFYLILQITSLTPETVLLTFKVSLYRSESIASLLFSCISLLILCAPQSQIYTLLYSIGASVSYIPFDLPLL